MTRKKISLNAEDAAKLNRALSANSVELYQLIHDPQPEVLLTILKNRQINDEHLLALLKRRDLPEELLSRIYQRRSESLSHKLLLALVKNPALPGNILRSLLPQLRLFELVYVCFMPGVTPDQRMAAERIILQRLPTTPLGNKITLARRTTANVVAELLKEGNPAVMGACLNSPRLKEAAIFQFLRGPKTSAETISMIARHSRWQQRPNLRLAILKNPHTPDIWFTLWLPKLPPALLKQLLAAPNLKAKQKKLIGNELKCRRI
ncbi:MAG: hypothetical protein KAT20_01985 [Desulfuromonadales bacterium]|nr:hypothetical protein [Desulfuromonadales bacterium]